MKHRTLQMDYTLFSFTTIHTWPTSLIYITCLAPASCLSLRSLLFISTHHHECTHIHQGPTHLAVSLLAPNPSPSWWVTLLFTCTTHPKSLLISCPRFAALLQSNISKAVSRMLSLTENRFTSESFDSNILLFNHSLVIYLVFSFPLTSRKLISL